MNNLNKRDIRGKYVQSGIHQGFGEGS